MNRVSGEISWSNITTSIRLINLLCSGKFHECYFLVFGWTISGRILTSCLVARRKVSALDSWIIEAARQFVRHFFFNFGRRWEIEDYQHDMLCSIYCVIFHQWRHMKVFWSFLRWHCSKRLMTQQKAFKKLSTGFQLAKILKIVLVQAVWFAFINC